MKTWKLAMFLLAIVLIVPVVCLAIDQIKQSGDDTIVFIEYKNNARGQLIDGTYAGRTLSGQEYVYDAEKGLLTCTENVYVNSSLKALLGTTQSLMQDAGNGLSAQINEIYSLPTSASGVKICEVLENGTVILQYNGSVIRLAPGERWEQIYSENIRTDDYRVKIVKSDIIKNNGRIRVSSTNV